MSRHAEFVGLVCMTSKKKRFDSLSSNFQTLLLFPSPDF